MIELALGLRANMLTEDNFRFAKQLGCDSIVVTLFSSHQKIPVESRFYQLKEPLLAVERDDSAWELDNLLRLVSMAERNGLRIGAIQNFNPADYYDVLLAGKEREVQIARIKKIIKNIGAAGIKKIGYHFNIAGVLGRKRNPDGRGGAGIYTFDAQKVSQEPIPNGMVWDRIYNFFPAQGSVSPVTSEEIWERFTYFLTAIIDTAENSDVQLAMHPTDPPIPVARKTSRLIYKAEDFDRLLDISDSPYNMINLCIGTLGEMEECNVPLMVEKYARLKRVSFIHLRNIKGRIPFYKEVFIDEGDLDIVEIIKILRDNRYNSFVMPDHAPVLSCPESWYASMAYSLGYLRALISQNT